VPSLTARSSPIWRPRFHARQCLRHTNVWAYLPSHRYVRWKCCHLLAQYGLTSCTATPFLRSFRVSEDFDEPSDWAKKVSRSQIHPLLDSDKSRTKQYACVNLCRTVSCDRRQLVSQVSQMSQLTAIMHTPPKYLVLLSARCTNNCGVNKN
jgi:hypothetical protein